MPLLNTLAQKKMDPSFTFADRVHFVHLYNIEPHPTKPTVSPYTGKVWESTYSQKGQPLTYTARVANAKAMTSDIKGNQLHLVDDLTPGKLNNPAWCAYGTCPNCAFLIDKQGKIREAQLWVDATKMESAIRALFPK